MALFQGRSSPSSPFPECPAERTLKLHRTGKIPGPEVNDDTRDLPLMVTGKEARGSWNKQAAFEIALAYVKYEDALTKDVFELQELVLRHIPALVAQYKNMHDIKDKSLELEAKARYGRRRKVLGIFCSCGIWLAEIICYSWAFVDIRQRVTTRILCVMLKSALQFLTVPCAH